MLPPARRAWASWNIAYERPAREETPRYLVSYLLNRIQPIPAPRPVLVSLGRGAVDRDKVLARMQYRHPMYSIGALATQKALPSLGGGGHLHFCGSYFGAGFHEDAIASAINVTRRFGMEL